ncbi:hypothetical protein V8C37DRAFT_366633 [Trichoderma ceciliae]
MTTSRLAVLSLLPTPLLFSCIKFQRWARGPKFHILESMIMQDLSPRMPTRPEPVSLMCDETSEATTTKLANIS